MSAHWKGKRPGGETDGDTEYVTLPSPGTGGCTRRSRARATGNSSGLEREGEIRGWVEGGEQSQLWGGRQVERRVRVARQKDEGPRVKEPSARRARPR